MIKLSITGENSISKVCMLMYDIWWSGVLGMMLNLLDAEKYI